MRKIVLSFFCAISLFSSELYIAGGAGYKRPLQELAMLFESRSGHTVKMMFGNMQQISEQIKASDKVSIFFGDEKFINKLGIQYKESVILGRGILMLVLKNGLNFEPTFELLKSEKIANIGLPHTTNAIYGIAGKEALEKSATMSQVESKLKILQSVPQVSAYLVNGDLDAGFINKTDYLGNKDRLGAVAEVDESLYTPIRIIGVVLSGREQSQEVRAMMEFLKSDEAIGILEKNGL
ncbi:MAG: molybdate ABC transporter substrate-binding protein [Wolinella sp.]